MSTHQPLLIALCQGLNRNADRAIETLRAEMPFLLLVRESSIRVSGEGAHHLRCDWVWLFRGNSTANRALDQGFQVALLKRKVRNNPEETRGKLRTRLVAGLGGGVQVIRVLRGG